LVSKVPRYAEKNFHEEIKKKLRKKVVLKKSETKVLWKAEVRI